MDVGILNKETDTLNPHIDHRSVSSNAHLLLKMEYAIMGIFHDREAGSLCVLGRENYSDPWGLCTPIKWEPQTVNPKKIWNGE